MHVGKHFNVDCMYGPGQKFLVTQNLFSVFLCIRMCKSNGDKR